MKFLIRADGSRVIGLGHIFRTLSLAQELTSLGHQVLYLCRDLKGLPKSRIKACGFKIILMSSTITPNMEKEYLFDFIRQERPEWVVVDHYPATEDYYAFLKKNKVKVMVIDDNNQTRFPVDILLNQNINASEYKYMCGPETIQLLGPAYALVRSVYAGQRKKAKIRTSLKKILLFFGGADHKNQTLKVLKAIEKSTRAVKVYSRLGSAYRFVHAIRNAAKKSHLVCEIYQDIPDLAGLMLRSDLAIGAGGSVCWEMCTLKLPMLLMPFEANQMAGAQGLAKDGSAVMLGWFSKTGIHRIADILNSITNAQITSMSRKAANICDGLGIDRVVKTILSLSG